VKEVNRAIRGEALSVREAAKRAYISKSKLYDLMKMGQLPFPYIMIGPKKRVIDSVDIEDWLNKLKIPVGRQGTKK
ncbi:MAG: helix-turn-helix domain-containing protein, partial [Treponema sp.]|jgi:excisionase family DNA binding protein|nr:helix-turn-helix domain-containing protein [Treponema sp.]